MSAEREAAEPERTAGYVSGPAAATEPRRHALNQIVTANRIVLVEGITDQIAIDALAARLHIDLDQRGTVIAPMGGAHAIGTFLDVIAHRRIPPEAVGGLCDRREASVFKRALSHAGFGQLSDDADLAAAGFSVCDADLEAELIRAAGPDCVVALIEEHGDLSGFRSLQQQAPWRGRPLDDQLHRFLRARARRMHTYARILVDAVAVERVPRPLLGVVDLL